MSPPRVTHLEFIHISGFIFLFKVGLSDETAVKQILIGKDFKKSIACESIIDGDSKNGLFESAIDIEDLDGYLALDSYGNQKDFYKDSYLYTNSEGFSVYFTIPVPDVQLKIENVTYLVNDIDIADKPCYNTIYFNSSTIPRDYPLKFLLTDDISTEDFQENLIKESTIRWDDRLKLFYCDFIVPKNTNHKVINYKISSPYKGVKSHAFPPLRVLKTNFDNDGPIISSITNIDGKTGWRIGITDTPNGFSNGYIKAIGSKDSSIFKFNFTIANAIQGGTIYDGQYEFVIDIPGRCIAQNFTIEYIYLEDTNKRISRYSRGDKNYKPEKDPLRNFNGESSVTRATSTCSKTTFDTSPPELTSFTPSTISIDVGSLDRNIVFKFAAQDPDSGLMLSQKPKVYLTSINMETIECESNIISSTEDWASYECKMEIPLGFGYPGNLLVSVYGFINNEGYYSGFANDAPEIGSYSRIETTLSPTPILTSYEPMLYYSTSDIIVYGHHLDSVSYVNITYSDGITRSYSNLKKFGKSAIVIAKDDIAIIGPFNVTAFYPTKTNTIIVLPTYFNTTGLLKPFEPTSTPELTKTPIPTNKPQQCLGSPLCGGPSHGKCVENQGCVCVSPWIGIDCSSRIVIVDPPLANNSDPSTEIVLPDSKNENGNNYTVTYKSLITLVSLREINIFGDVIYSKSFDKWIVTTQDNSTFIYKTSLEIKNTTTTNVTVTLKWFSNETTISFADQQLLMYPSTIKYTIEIGNYPFQSSLTSLQLVMSALLQSNTTDNICSAKEFGETTSGDNSNYLKIQVDDHSLYGRFIKRGFIDSTIKSVSNILLDKDMNPITSTQTLQSYIGIQIDNFKESVIIDPDFSVLLDSSSASSKTNSICLRKSKLTGSQIAGIVIGCVAFVAVVSISIVYTIYKNKKNKQFMKDVAVKLGQLNN
ncbi:hypothetical protein DICPUDRAFT_28690 [Dictyostelium purpureum]|uniref:EGF-like domain-containing protein n=1 Tax=Dictyostelium purpureum TaxID=5786 RepID=F0ZCE1_DICPU|nr:uncharacterized protein DICPUDRAFT_28690 [Dictyostelium purpureum]EGC38428.1 hypothetical protein DICPUDRAFT_28690 [Dictyostelium purpureum]|eukprot:XP_003285089.1 hypothetical protein DICPUDRAFT_28690 [Dictyostelium purpureum]